jgi:hypothetical protein
MQQPHGSQSVAALLEQAQRARHDGMPGTAESLLLEALQQCCQGRTLDATVVGRLHALAYQYTRRRQYSSAERLYHKVLEARMVALGPNHPAIADSLRRIASVMRLTWRTNASQLLEARASEILSHQPGKVAG